MNSLFVPSMTNWMAEGDKQARSFARYRYCPTLEVYILVSQDEPYVEVYQRAKNWRQEHFSADQVAKLDQLNLELPLTSIYEGVFS